jgi:surfeit locus 1 family protein
MTLVKRWWLPTILVILGMIGLARLGVWQLDRLQQKRDYNTMMAERWRQEPFDLNASALPADLEELALRRIEAQGEFDYSRQIVLKNQFLNQGPGIQLVTPFVLEPGRAVLVARGWLPLEYSDPARWAEVQEPAGAPVLGLIQESETIEGAAPPEDEQREWFRVDVAAIQQQMPYSLEPGFILMLPEEGRPASALPIRSEPPLLDEGNHLSYAIQWFTFALILGFGYIMLVRSQERKRRRRELGLDEPEPPIEDMPLAPPGAAHQP